MTSADTWSPTSGPRRGLTSRTGGSSGWGLPIVLLLITLAVWVGIIVDAL